MNSQKLSIKNMIGYGFGDFASNLVWQMLSLYLLFFYTDVFGISAAAAGTLFLVARVWDAINDPIMGSIVDKTHTKWGKFRPYLLFGAIPLGIASVLCFTTPDFSMNGKMIYAYVTYIVLGMTYTIVSIPYSALTSSMTDDSHERTKLTTARMIFAMFGLLVVAAATEPLVGMFPTKAIGYRNIMVIYSILAVALYWLCFALCKETVEVKPKHRAKAQNMFQVLFSNKPLFLITCTSLCTMIAGTMKSAMVIYYCKYNMDNEAFVTAALLTVVVFMILGNLLVPLVSKKVGKRKGMIIGNLIAIVGNIIFFFVPYENIVLMLAFTAIASIGMAFVGNLGWSMIPDTIEYGQWKTGIRAEGTVYSVFSFSQKLGHALGGALPGFILTFVHYVPNMQQTVVVQNTITHLLTTIPNIFYMLAILSILGYEITEEKFKLIKEEIA